MATPPSAPLVIGRQTFTSQWADPLNTGSLLQQDEVINLARFPSGSALLDPQAAEQSRDHLQTTILLNHDTLVFSFSSADEFCLFESAVRGAFADSPIPCPRLSIHLAFTDSYDQLEVIFVPYDEDGRGQDEVVGADEVLDRYIPAVIGSSLTFSRIYLSFSADWCYFYGMDQHTQPLLDSGAQLRVSFAQLRVSFGTPESATAEHDILRAVTDFGGFADTLAPYEGPDEQEVTEIPPALFWRAKPTPIAEYRFITLWLILRSQGPKHKDHPNCRKGNSLTALHLAVSCGHLEIVELLLDYGASIDDPYLGLCNCVAGRPGNRPMGLEDRGISGDRWTPLHLAFCGEFQEIAALRLSRVAQRMPYPSQETSISSRECERALKSHTKMGRWERDGNICTWRRDVSADRDRTNTRVCLSVSFAVREMETLPCRQFGQAGAMAVPASVLPVGDYNPPPDRFLPCMARH
ncbi:uncharacterized protein B0I36DRAFT_370138 [Microdochium trichocladiopsis]|uniref:Ankyrin repeat-containing domain protein n=1 Tax=Microdochium trichocladiopsis TaxID=1682393 RepID=A0A9P8XQ76_9PEZI|nr:uncharacterized protein B0I36DRAFT_370138 [Microdochium trichocladiopsis]KAH7010855.1 hypothetical protein B0I36DRAFT_370138 [Microdochium trichocladiopsis]